MANDIDMYNDIDDYADNGAEKGMVQDLLDCYTARYQEGNIKEAEKFKDRFTIKWGFWDNWY